MIPSDLRLLVGPRPSRIPLALAAILTALALLISGCVDQSQGGDVSDDGSSDEIRVVATSPSVAQVCDALGMDLVGVPESENVPERYADVTTVGAPMSPDMEIIASLDPDYVISPITLQEDLESQYEAIGVGFYFMNTRSVDGLFESIEWMGAEFGCEEEAQALIDAHGAFMDDLNAQIEGEESPTVLILMGVPGSYIVATENSYVGSLVELAGGENIYAGTDDEFLNANTEDMQMKDPDIILRAAHGVEADVQEMFAEEFSENDIWSHFTAVQEGRVYDLPFDTFGMSATLDYTEALEYLLPLLYDR